MQITAIFAVAENTFYKGTREDDKSVRGALSLETLIPNISEKACGVRVIRNIYGIYGTD